MATDNKYDRQLRLWGPNGQAALMQARVLMFGCGPTATETLKNLVLPGIGHFTIVDEANVSPADLGNNFFVSQASLGSSRAAICTELLCEMNSDVRGEYRNINPATIIDDELSYITQFDLIIATNLSEQLLLKLADICYENEKPLIVPRSYGFIGYIRLQLVDHSVVEAKPDADTLDLSLANPFPELEEYANTFDLQSLDSMQHAHVPYVVILLQALQKWKASHSNSLPSTIAEKNAFKEHIKSMSRGFDHEINFGEAYKEAYRAYVVREAPQEVLEALEHPKTLNLTPSSDNFWFLLAALREFLSTTGCPPLSGQIPDMTALTDSYVRLQQVYQIKATRDRAVMRETVTKLQAEAGKAPDMISEDELDIFCKNILNLQVVNTRSLLEERNSPAFETVMMAMMDPFEDKAQTPILWYLSLRAVDRFFVQEGRYPGVMCPDLNDDAIVLWRVMQELRIEYGQTAPQLSEDHAKEMCRYGACEVHNISAIVGGIAAQEAVKIITHQYVPLNNTLIFNGIATVSAVYEL